MTETWWWIEVKLLMNNQSRHNQFKRTQSNKLQVACKRHQHNKAVWPQWGHQAGSEHDQCYQRPCWFKPVSSVHPNVSLTVALAAHWSDRSNTEHTHMHTHSPLFSGVDAAKNIVMRWHGNLALCEVGHMCKCVCVCGCERKRERGCILHSK